MSELQGMSQSGLLIVVPIYNSVHVITDKGLIGVYLVLLTSQQLVKRDCVYLFYCLKSSGGVEPTHGLRTQKLFSESRLIS